MLIKKTMTAVVVLSAGFVDLTTGTLVAGTNGDTLVSQAFGLRRRDSKGNGSYT